MRWVPLVIFLLGLGIVLFGGVLYWKKVSTPPCASSLRIRRQTICVEIADTDASRDQGLSGRPKLPPGTGMLFVFPFSSRPTFWMKEMRFPLDFIWMEKGKVVALTPQVPAPDPTTPLSLLPVYPAPVAVDQVLEVPAGSIADWGIATGDAVIRQ